MNFHTYSKYLFYYNFLLISKCLHAVIYYTIKYKIQTRIFPEKEFLNFVLLNQAKWNLLISFNAAHRLIWKFSYL